MSTFDLYLSRAKRLCLFTVAMIIRFFSRTDKNQLFFWSYSFEKYGCSPAAFSEYLLRCTENNYTLVWAFSADFDASQIDPRIKVVRTHTLRYLIELYRSGVVINNMRNDLFESYFLKKKSQKYIMMWHGPFALKRIEKDAENQLGKSYVRNAKLDSKMCDLMLSNSQMLTRLLKSSFWYDGEVLERCMPRNDVFHDKKKRAYEFAKVRKDLGLSLDTKIVLYAPTFRRGNKDMEFYQINWQELIPVFERMLGGKVEVLIRLHPNMSKMQGIEILTDFPHVHNITQAPDINPFLFAADAMVSDYTSAMFDYCMLHKPCFIYAKDKDDYDRGFYFKLEELPFPLAESESQLKKNVEQYNERNYLMKLDAFVREIWALDEDGKSCERLHTWLKANA